MGSSRTRLWTGAALALVTGAAFAVAAGARSHGDFRHGDGLGRFGEKLEQLDLDAETRQAVSGLLDAAREQKRELRDEMREAHQQLRDLLHAEAPDLDAVMAQADVIGSLETRARKAGLRTMLAIRGLLTEEQRAALREGRGGHGRHRGDDRL